MSSGTSTAFNEKKTNKTRTVNEQNTRKYYISKWKREKKKELALADSRITAKYDMHAHRDVVNCYFDSLKSLKFAVFEYLGLLDCWLPYDIRYR